MRTGSYDVAFYLPTLGPLIDPAAAVPFSGGAETQIWLLARGLAKRGHAVCVVVVDIAGGLPKRMEGVEIIVRPRWQGGRGVLGQLAELRTLWRTLRPVHAGVVVQRAAGFSTGLVGMIARALGRRFVYSSANMVDFDYHRLASSRKDLWLFQLGVRLADRVIVQTSEQASRCRAKFGRDATVIRSIAERAELSERDPDLFLWIGRLVSYKRPLAFLSLARALPEARFQMVGLGSGNDPAIEQAVRREAAELPNVELLPTLPRAELLSLYERAVAVVNTSDWEGMPNTFLEGWARGVPALALTHDPDGLIESEQLGGFAGGSPERLAELARELWSTRLQHADLASRCAAYVGREHAAERVISQWIEALDLAPKTASVAVQSDAGSSTYAQVP